MQMSRVWNHSIPIQQTPNKLAKRCYLLLCFGDTPVFYILQIWFTAIGGTLAFILYKSFAREAIVLNVDKSI